jgi:pimeloyl-ACP methyl ester carboxylesterase
MRLLRGPICLALLLLALYLQQGSLMAQVEGRKVSVGDYRLFLNCTGDAPGPTVILLAGGGSTASVWSKVQPQVAEFARVCSYDREATGMSDATIPPKQTAVEIAEDLHALLVNGSVKPPYVLVGHSIGGVYARVFTSSYPTMVSGLVFVDSADEEQVWRFEKISHSLLFEYKEWPDRYRLAQQGFLPPGALLKWHCDVPLIVLEHGITWPRGIFKGMTESEYQETKDTWDLMQLDLSKRSKYGQLRIAEKSGHFIHKDQPEVVVKAVRDVMTMHETP